MSSSMELVSESGPIDQGTIHDHSYDHCTEHDHTECVEHQNAQHEFQKQLAMLGQLAHQKKEIDTRIPRKSHNSTYQQRRTKALKLMEKRKKQTKDIKS